MVKEVILYDASRGRSDCGANTTSRQRRQHCLPEKLSNPVCLRRMFTVRFWELWSFATENVGFYHRFFSYKTMFIKENIFKYKQSSKYNPTHVARSGFPALVARNSFLLGHVINSL